jgi:hypothetical protein
MKWRTDFYTLQSGAAPEALARLRSAAPAPLPDSLYELLAFSNGGDWPAGGGQFSFHLLSAEEIAETCAWAPRRANAMHEFLKGFVLIGTNGGGLCIGLDVRGAPPWPIIEFDRDADAEDRVAPVAADFDAFLSLLGV